jgi:hypothetical protein
MTEALQASAIGVNLPSGTVLLALVPVLLLLAGLVAGCLVDLIRAAEVRYLPKWAWVLVIVLCSAPFGPLLYLLLGRERNGHVSSDDEAPYGVGLSGRSRTKWERGIRL